MLLKNHLTLPHIFCTVLKEKRVIMMLRFKHLMSQVQVWDFLTVLKWSLNERASAEHLLLLSGLLSGGKVCLFVSVASSTWYLLYTREADLLCFSSAGSHFPPRWNHLSHKLFSVTWRDNEVSEQIIPVQWLVVKGVVCLGN